MDNHTHSLRLPEKVVRRHAEILEDLVPELARLVQEEQRPVDTMLNSYLRAHRELGSRDRRFLSQAVFSYFRWYGWTVGKLDMNASEACLVGAALDSDDLAQSFRYLESRCNLPFPVEPLGSNSLEEKLAVLNRWFQGSRTFQPLALSDLVLPEFGILVDSKRVEACIESFQQRPPTWIRVRSETEAFAQALSNEGIEFGLHPNVKDAVSIGGGTNLTHKFPDQTGRFVVQDLASQCVGLVAGPREGEDWWDCCAGAGGKTLHLMDQMGPEGKVLASDVRIAALKELKKRARKHGIRNIRTQPFNAASDEPFTKTFDGVLVDAPCSGWGTWNRNPDARWRTSQKDVAQCATRQLKILNNVKWCIRPGGTLIYSVCTITQPETEEVVMNFLDQHSDFKLEPFENPLTGEPTVGHLQIWPWEGPGDGMFVARFRRDDK